MSSRAQESQPREKVKKSKFFLRHFMLLPPARSLSLVLSPNDELVPEDWTSFVPTNRPNFPKNLMLSFCERGVALSLSRSRAQGSKLKHKQNAELLSRFDKR